MDAQALEEAEDSETPKKDIIGLIIAAFPLSSSSSESARVLSSERERERLRAAQAVGATPSSSSKGASGSVASVRPETPSSGSSSERGVARIAEPTGQLSPLGSRQNSAGAEPGHSRGKLAVGSLVRVLKAGPNQGRCATVIAHEGYDEQFDADADPTEFAKLDLLVDSRNRVRVEMELTGEIETFPLSQLEPLAGARHSQASLEVEVALKQQYI